MEDNLNQRQSQQKTTSMEEKPNGKRPQWKTPMEDDLYGIQPQWKTNSMKDKLNGRQTQQKINGGSPQQKTT